MSHSPAKVVIIGAGFGGLTAAKALKKGPAEVVIIDKTNHHLFQPLLYQVASSALSPADIATPIREILGKQKNTFVIMSEVLSIDKEKKLVHLMHTEPISFDYLIISVGTRHSYFGNNEWEPIAPGIKTLSDALMIREKVLTSFEIAERLASPKEAEKYMNFVVIGGGPTGVELAGAFAEIAYTTMAKDFKRINVNKTKIILVEAAPSILNGYKPKLIRAAFKDLKKLGVQILTGKMVTKVTEDGVEMGGEFLPSKNVIWAAGNQASPLLSTLNTPLDRQGRVVVENDLSIPGFPNIFVIGDAALVKNKEGMPIPAIAPAAVQGGKYVAKIIKKQTPPNQRIPFAYFDKGMMATIGRGKAIASVGPLAITGFTAWLAWGFIHIAYLIGFKNKLLVMMQWIFWYFTGKRPARLIAGTLEESHSPHHRDPPAV